MNPRSAIAPVPLQAGPGRFTFAHRITTGDRFALVTSNESEAFRALSRYLRNPEDWTLIDFAPVVPPSLVRRDVDDGAPRVDVEARDSFGRWVAARRLRDLPDGRVVVQLVGAPESPHAVRVVPAAFVRLRVTSQLRAWGAS